MLGLSDGRLASSFDDNTIKITNDFNFSNYSTLIGHTDIVNALSQFNKEILELYFSNKKRSGGENVREISFNSKYHKIAYVSFKDFESKQIT